ncbi:Sugar efflux transporter C [Jeotgalicoccus saudimassiliensis]|uniref:Sugar efflux transporter C n=1 Tax=Jeotgalicoccus saudimassiliensis TaxID=1461582 RepID=A0A078M0L0_9STAP|nr:sugar efflux transporter [Jeotgalicoccus saudimassiliensis]CDZ98942.1 Sugar efflux transporter C [Jeotgalicoccus saudimassiliensis]
MVKDLFQIQNYKLFLTNMTMLGMAVAITAPFLVIFMTETHGLSSTGYGIFMAAAAVGSFFVNTIMGRYSDRLKFDRKYLIIAALLMQILAFLSFLIIPNTWILIISYIIFFSLGAPAMPQLYASARESINQYRSGIAVMANMVLRSMFSFGFLFGPLVGSVLLARYDFTGLFFGTVIMFAVVFMSSFLIKNSAPPAEAVQAIEITNYEEPKSPNLLTNPALLIPFIAFVSLHVGQWMYLLNMPLFVTGYLGEADSAVGILASLCAGLEVPLMIFMGYVASRVSSKTLLIIAGFIGSMYFLSIGIFESYTMMLIGQLPLALFLAILLGLGISYFQDLLPQFPGYASTLFANAMIAGQLVGNLLGGIANDALGVENSFYVSGAFLFIAFILFFFTKKEVKKGEI